MGPVGIHIFSAVSLRGQGDSVRLSATVSAPEEKPEATIGKWGHMVLGGLHTRLALDPDLSDVRVPLDHLPVSVTTSQSIYYFIRLSYFTLLFSIIIHYY